MRVLLLPLLALAACAAEVPLLPDAGACGGACGPGTTCEGGRCVAADGGELGDAAEATDDAAAAVDACLRPVWTDTDGDGYGAGAPRMAGCDVVPAGFAAMDGDCDDRNPAAHPTATETCNGVDEDCDGRADDDPGQVFGPGNTAPTDHSLTRWCEAQLARYPDLAARVATFGGLRRCLSSMLAPSASSYLSREARCYAGSGATNNACWRAGGEIPCR
jgi:hypothetical protein